MNKKVHWHNKNVRDNLKPSEIDTKKTVSIYCNPKILDKRLRLQMQIIDANMKARTKRNKKEAPDPGEGSDQQYFFKCK